MSKFHNFDTGHERGGRALFVERVVPEAVSPDLAQALVMLYCRHLDHPTARQTLRRMVQDDAALLRQFDALDELHADFPFAKQEHVSLFDELMLLYRHNAQMGALSMLRQLRLLCSECEPLTRAFCHFDAEFGLEQSHAV